MAGRNGLTKLFSEAEGVGKNWGWFLALGILLLVLGALVINAAVSATLFSMVFFGVLLLGGGIIQIVQAFLARQWGGLFLSLLLGILYFVTGALCVAHPAASAVNITFLIAAFCFITGLFKMVSSLMMRFESWGWAFFNGAVTFVLGILIYSQWPLSGLWVIGLFIGVDLILAGWTWILMSLAARKYIR